MKNKNYPLYEVTPFSSIREMLNIAVAASGDKAAFKFCIKDGTVAEVTYREFAADVNALLASLTELGISMMHIAQIGDNSYRWIVTYLASLISDNVFVPIDRELPGTDVVNLINSGDCDVFFYDDRHESIITDNIDNMERIKYFIFEELPDDDEASFNDSRFISFTYLIKHGKELINNGYTAHLDKKSKPNELKMLVYTSGTTGSAKGVMLSEHNLVSSVYYGLQVSTVFERSLSVLPYHHTYEAVSGILVSLHKHVTICINENLKSVMKNLTLFKPDFIYLVPAFAEEFYRRIWANAKRSGRENGLKKLIKTSNALRRVGIDARKKLFVSIHDAFGGNLKKIVCGGAPIRPELGEFFDAVGINLINGYGITECSPLVAANRDYFNNCETVGVPLPCCEIKFIDVTSDGEGEICVKGDIVMLGYYKQPELTAEVLDSDGWFKTGDYGKMNEKGQLLITGRKKNIIVLSNGKNIYPEEIENQILNIPYVKEVVVYGLKNQYGDENKLCAEVFLNSEKVEELQISDPAESLKNDIANSCAGFPSYKSIGKIIIRSKEFDKTTSNKIKRQNIEK